MIQKGGPPRRLTLIPAFVPLLFAADAAFQPATGILYAIDERELAQSFVSDVSKETGDISLIAALAKLSAQYDDAQVTLVIGEKVLERGMGMERYAFPDFGVPSFKTMGAMLDRCIVYSAVRSANGKWV